MSTTFLPITHDQTFFAFPGILAPVHGYFVDMKAMHTKRKAVIIGQVVKRWIYDCSIWA